MKIEVLSPKNAPTKEKGDLLENLAKKLLEVYNFEVIQEIRFTAMELDLLCKSKVNGKQIYVECKAMKENIGAPILRQLLGTVNFQDYAEGWLISTSEFGKEAKGFVETWKSKPIEVSQKLSFYTPDLVIDALIKASLISDKPVHKANEFLNGNENVGEWFLLISKFGNYWATYSLKGGAPNGILFFNAKTSERVKDKDTIQNISVLDGEFSGLDLYIGVEKQKNELIPYESTNVVEVQTGESWDDYRPSRPEDFIGRDDLQKEILNFLETAKVNNGSRVFAITGNSGLGKSSLIAKVRNRSRNIRYKNKIFVYAVDIRGATDRNYIFSALLMSIKNAQRCEIGSQIDVKITDPTNPFNSDSFQEYLESLDQKNQVVCLVFDQFEELYSKPELFEIFKAARNLMINVASIKKNFVLGFAWKTDSTTQQDHPAYHMWHDLSDHRREYKLNVFNSGEIDKSLTKFEKTISYKLPAETRHQIKNSSQGYPWLLKKLFINLSETINKNEKVESFAVDIDVARLFDADLETLDQNETTCLKIIAEKAPADWSEIIEASGLKVLSNLINKRLVVRSGDRLNIYWDIFKDYLLTKKTPVIPFNYVPTTDISSLLKVCKVLKNECYLSANEIAKLVGLKEKTVWNIGADLVMLGLSEREGTSFKLHRDFPIYTDFDALNRLKSKFEKHSFKLYLYKKHLNRLIDLPTIKLAFKESIPSLKVVDQTRNTYSNRLVNFLILTGLITKNGNRFSIQESTIPSSIKTGIGRTSSRKSAVFSVSVSPLSCVEELKRISQGVSDKSLISRNALHALRRLDLVQENNGVVSVNQHAIQKFGGYAEAVWSSASNEGSLMLTARILNANRNVSLIDLATIVANEFKIKWSHGSLKRNGGVLMQWGSWIIDGVKLTSVPSPPGRGMQ